MQLADQKETLRDLAIDSFVSGSALEEVPNSELLLSMSIDIVGIKNWVKASNGMAPQ